MPSPDLGDCEVCVSAPAIFLTLRVWDDCMLQERVALCASCWDADHGEPVVAPEPGEIAASSAGALA